MKSHKISDIPLFMSHLLSKDSFDRFEVVNASLTTFVRYDIDGSYISGYFPEEINPETTSKFAPWGLVRPCFYQLIKGSSKPQEMKVVLRLSDENSQKVLSGIQSSLTAADVTGLYLNITYKNNEAVLTSGCSLRIFTIDKTVEQTWDGMAKRFFLGKQIPLEDI